MYTKYNQPEKLIIKSNLNLCLHYQNFMVGSFFMELAWDSFPNSDILTSWFTDPYRKYPIWKHWMCILHFAFVWYLEHCWNLLLSATPVREEILKNLKSVFLALGQNISEFHIFCPTGSWFAKTNSYKFCLNINKTKHSPILHTYIRPF